MGKMNNKGYFQYWGKARQGQDGAWQCHLFPYHCFDVAAVGRWVEKKYFAIVDVIEVLTISYNQRSYLEVLKRQLKKEGSEVVTFCNHLKAQI